MTIQELITELSAFPPDAIVRSYDWTWRDAGNEITSVYRTLNEVTQAIDVVLKD